MKRKHQVEFEKIIDDIGAGAGTKDIILHATPGSGKSAIPIIAGKLIARGLVDRLCWIVPRKSLQDQGERNFVDPFFRNMLDHKMLIRQSTNEDDPSRGLSGFITTYQAAGIDGDQTLLFEFMRRRYVLILDEFHHVELDGIWYKTIKPLYDAAFYRVLMTGTLERGDKCRIAFMPYRETAQGFVPDIHPSASTAVVKYTRADALKEQAILPLKFHLNDARAAWIDKEGGEHAVYQVSTLERREIAAQAVFAIVNSEFAEQLLRSALEHWLKWKQIHQRSKMLVVTASIERAKAVLKSLQGRFRCAIATSDDSTEAHKNILAMKCGLLDVLVTVAMAHEGLDIPEVSHVACLTNIRSRPWIEQMIARAVRIDRHGLPYHEQRAFVFAPDDMLMRDIVEGIRLEQLPFATAGEQLDLFGGDGTNEGPKKQIKPLESEMIGGREIDLAGDVSAMGMVKTPTDIEGALRDRIDRHIKMYAWKGRYNPKRLNVQVKEIFGKPRAEMTLEELRAVYRYVSATFDIARVRGTGRRVPTKARLVSA